MTLDIDKLTEAELVDLNHRIIARLGLLIQMRSHVDMLAFRIGDRVAFQPSGQARIEGMVTRYNKRTVTIITDDGAHWNVAPNLIGKVGPNTKSDRGTLSVAGR